MATRKVITTLEDEEFLRKVSKPVEKFDKALEQLIEDMCDTVDKYQGAGISAVQIGVLRRVFVVAIGEKQEYINPVILGVTKKTKIVREGCLSVVEKSGKSIFKKVRRPIGVRVRAQDKSGNWFEKDAFGYEAQCILHEYDHLDGHLYTDLVEED